MSGAGDITRFYHQEQVLALAAQGPGTVNGNPFRVENGEKFGISVALANKVSTPTVTVYLQHSPDYDQVANKSNASWYDVPFDDMTVTTAGAGDVTPTTLKRNIVPGATNTGQYYARYAHCPVGVARLVAIVSGAASAMDINGYVNGKAV